MSDKIEEALAQIRKEFENLEAKQVLSEEALEHLREIYKVAWIEGCYDPYNEKSYEAAVKIWPHIRALNEELKFRT
jgi:hypothetical protein